MDKLARDVMQTPVLALEPTDSLHTAESKLVSANVSGMPVMDGDKLVGILSRSDFVRIPMLLESLDSYIQQELAERPESVGTKIKPLADRFGDMSVRDIMTTTVHSCDVSTPVRDVAKIMVTHHVHRVVVVEGNVVVGVMESLDIVGLAQA